MRFIRWALGRIILLLDWLFTPKGIKRSPENQAAVDKLTSDLALFEYRACPFCVKVRRALKRNTLKITTYDAKRCDTSRNQLLQGGGKLQVPCLRIKNAKGDDIWMYESSDIITYIESTIRAHGLTQDAIK